MCSWHSQFSYVDLWSSLFHIWPLNFFNRYFFHQYFFTDISFADISLPPLIFHFLRLPDMYTLTCHSHRSSRTDSKLFFGSLKYGALWRILKALCKSPDSGRMLTILPAYINIKYHSCIAMGSNNIIYETPRNLFPWSSLSSRSFQYTKWQPKSIEVWSVVFHSRCRHNERQTYKERDTVTERDWDIVLHIVMTASLFWIWFH